MERHIAKIKVIFFAHHNTGYRVIEQVGEKNHIDIQKVYTHKDTAPEGVWFKSVYELCKRNKIPVAVPKNVNEHYDEIKKLSPDLIFTIGFKQIIGKSLIELPKFGCINLHGSLLPRYRGRCPVNWALINGEKYSGVTAHYIEKDVDVGDIVAQRKVKINHKDDIRTLSEKIYEIYPPIVLEVINNFGSGKINRKKQDETKASYFEKREPKDGKIDWNKRPLELYNFVRALTKPYPGAFSFLNKNRVNICKIRPFRGKEFSSTSKRGTIIKTENSGIFVKVKDGIVVLEKFDIKGNNIGKELLKVDMVFEND